MKEPEKKTQPTSFPNRFPSRALNDSPFPAEKKTETPRPDPKPPDDSHRKRYRKPPGSL